MLKPWFETGESHEQELNLTLSNRPVTIYLPIPEVVERYGTSPVYISMDNEFSGTVEKAVDISIYRLSQSVETNNENNWPPADLWPQQC